MRNILTTLGLLSIAGASFALGTPRGPALETTSPPPVPPSNTLEAPTTSLSGLPGAITISTKLDQSAIYVGSPSERFIEISLSAPDSESTTRQPVNIAVLIDNSGSMRASGKLDHAIAGTQQIAGMLNPEDSISVNTFSSSAQTVFPTTSAPIDRSRQSKIKGIRPAGGTNLYAGLELAVNEIVRHQNPQQLSRIFLLSDGQANEGLTDDASFSHLATNASSKDISLTTIGLGVDYNEDLLAKLADLGGGSYQFVDSPQHLANVFQHELENAASTVATHLQLRVDLPAGVEPVEFLGWDASPTSNGWTLDVGSLRAGQTKKLLARVRVTADSLGSFNVANVGLNYTDLASDSIASNSAIAEAEITQEQTVVTASTDHGLMKRSRKALSAKFVDLSTRAYAKGSREEAQTLLQQAKSTISNVASSMSTVEFEEEMGELDDQDATYQSVAPSSYEGKKAIISGKGKYRGSTR